MLNACPYKFLKLHCVIALQCAISFFNIQLLYITDTEISILDVVVLDHAQSLSD